LGLKASLLVLSLPLGLGPDPVSHSVCGISIESAVGNQEIRHVPVREIRVMTRLPSKMTLWGAMVFMTLALLAGIE
jgi:hypothetical protein